MEFRATLTWWVVCGMLFLSLTAQGFENEQHPRESKGLWDELPEAKRRIRARQKIRDAKHEPHSFFTSDDYIRGGPSQKREIKPLGPNAPLVAVKSVSFPRKNPASEIHMDQQGLKGREPQERLWHPSAATHAHGHTSEDDSQPEAFPQGSLNVEINANDVGSSAKDREDRRSLLAKIAQMVSKKRASESAQEQMEETPQIKPNLAPFQRHKDDVFQHWKNIAPKTLRDEGSEAEDIRVHRLNGITMRVLESSNLRRTKPQPYQQTEGPQSRGGGVNAFQSRFRDDRPYSGKVPKLDTSKFLRRHGSGSDRRMDEDGESSLESGQDGNRLAAQVTALTVLDKITEMQQEIKELNREIQDENRRIQAAQSELDGKSDLETMDTSKKENILETVREIKLKKEDTKMKAIETQIKLKRLQDRDRVGRDDPDLEAALQMVATRRKLIKEALLQQRQRSLERQKLAALALASKQSLDAERLRLAEELEQEVENRALKQRLAKQKELNAALETGSKILQKARNRAAHKKLAEASNQRVISKIQRLALKRRQEAKIQRNAIVKAQLSKLTSNLPLKSQLKSLRTKSALKATTQGLSGKKPSSLFAGLRPSSPLLHLTPLEMSQVLGWLDLQKNADILAKTNEKVAAKAKANNAAEALILDAAQQALGVDSITLTDSEVDDLLGVNEILPNEAALDLIPDYPDLVLDYPDPLDDYVDLEEVLVDYEYEYDTPLLPTGPLGPQLPIAPGLPLPHSPPHAYYSKPQPIAKPHSYQYFHQTQAHHHRPSKNHYHKPPKPYHPPPPKTYHPPPPKVETYYPLPKPESYHPITHHPKKVHHEEQYHANPHHQQHSPHYEEPHYEEPHYEEPYYEEPHYEEPHYEKPHYLEPLYKEPHYEQHTHSHHEDYRAPPKLPQLTSTYEYEKPKEVYHTPKSQYSPPKYPHHTEPDHYPDENHYSKPYVSERPIHSHAHHETHHEDSGYYRQPKYHKDHPDPYHEDHYYEEDVPNVSPGPFYAPSRQTGAQFLNAVSPILDVAASGIGKPQQLSGLLRHSLLRDIQDKVDTELHLGPGGQHTRVSIGNLPPERPRLSPPFASRSRRQIKGVEFTILDQGEAAQKPQKFEEVHSSQGVTFSDLMADFLERDPLPIHEKQQGRRA